MSLRRFGEYDSILLILTSSNEFLFAFSAAPPTTTTKQPSKNNEKRPQNRPRSKRKPKIVNPSRNLSRSERLQKRTLLKDKPTVTVNQPNHQAPPTPPPKSPQTASTSSVPDSESEQVRQSWTNLENDFSFSGDSDRILNKIKSFSVHKPIRKKFKRRAVIVPSIYHTFFCDLIDYKKLKGSNRNYSYVLVLIDAFSRFSWTRPLKTKEAKECANALDDILSKLPYRPSFFASDAGNEFNPKELW